MSLLRDVLRKNNARGGLEPPAELSLSSRRSLKTYAASIRSSGGNSIRSMRSIAESITSFYSTLTGNRLPKRRRPEVSRLGAPQWYKRDPPPPETVGAERLEEGVLGPFTMAHAFSSNKNATESPWCCVVLYSHATGNAPLPRYFNEANVRGEFRMVLHKPRGISSLDVWCLATAESVLELGALPFLQYHANLWKKSKGDRQLGDIEHLTVSNGRFPAGSYVFPFEFPPFPADVTIKAPIEKSDREGICRVHLPPSSNFGGTSGQFTFTGSIKYYIGVNVKYDDFISVGEEFEAPFAYYPRMRPILRPPTPFPFIPTREDWPFRREVLGGWTLTPFGGRGRFRDEMVEIEGILGVQAPEVYSAGQIVKFGLILWSTSPDALQALSQPDAFDIVYMRTGIYGTNVLQPHSAARRNREMHRLAQGRIWRTEDGPPSSDEPLRKKSEPSVPTPHEEDRTPSVAPRPKPLSRLQQTFSADDVQGVASKSAEISQIPHSESSTEPTLTQSTAAGVQPNNKTRSRSPSPTPSLEDLEEGDTYALGMDDVVRMDGDVTVVQAVPPSFRYKYMGCEYLLQLTITHPEYSHISPSGTGIQAETPLWIVTDPPLAQSQSQRLPGSRLPSTSEIVNLPIKGEVVEMSSDAVRAPVVLGETTTKERPTWRVQRLSSF